MEACIKLKDFLFILFFIQLGFFFFNFMIIISAIDGLKKLVEKALYEDENNDAN
jgi:hypothetical protein